MEILWNQKNLHRPPYMSWDASIKEFDSKKFIGIIEKILNDLKNLEVLHAEAGLLSRLIYRMKSKFRCDKGLKHMEKINRALLSYLNMSFEKEYELLKEYIEMNNGVISLPSRQTLEYILIKTQGFAKLMCRVELTAMIAGNIFNSRLRTGQSWSVAMIAYGVISRIWILSRYAIKQACIWYDNIYSYTKIFKRVGMPWLPDNYELPESLSLWLNLSWFDEDIEKLPMEKDWEKSIFNLIKQNDLVDEDINLVEDLIIETKKEIEKPVVPNEPICDQEDDLGKPISRDSFEASQISIPEKSIKMKTKEKDNENLENKSNLTINESQTSTHIKTLQNSNKKIEAKIKKKEKRKNEKLDKKSELFGIKSEKDLVRLLKADSCPGFDKLQWNMLQKRIKKFYIKLKKSKTCDSNDELYETVTQFIKKWIISQ